MAPHGQMNISMLATPSPFHNYKLNTSVINRVQIRYSSVMVATTTMRARFLLLLLLLGILFLASVSFTYGASAAQREEKESPCRDDEKCQEGEWREGRHPQDPEEREREEARREKQREWSQERQKEEERRPKEKEEQQQERGQGEQGSQSQKSRNNPFYFPSQRFQTRYGNEHGRVRVLQRFDRRSKKLENLQNYRLVQFEARPNTLVLPHHSDADYLLVVQEGEATVHLVNPNDRESYNLERGDALRIPSGTTFYIVNRHDNQNLRIAKLAIPVKKPDKFDDFFPASNEDQPKKQSYLHGFSRNTLQAAFNAPFEYIQRILLEENEGEQQHQQQQHGSQEEGVIVKLSKEQIQELTRDAKSSSRWGGSAESGPFNLRSRPIFSNQFGRFFEVTPERNPQLQDFDIFLSCVEIKEGALMLPHFNSKAIVVLVVNQGRGNLELVALRDEEQQQQRGQQEQQEDEEEEEEGTKQVRRYPVRLSRGDVVVIPAAYPVAINASSDMHLLGIGINAEKNQRNFLAGESDNVLKQIHRQVKELAFPGSGEEVERLFSNQRESYFVSAQPQQQRQEKEEGKQGRKDPLFSILGAFN